MYKINKPLSLFLFVSICVIYTGVFIYSSESSIGFGFNKPDEAAKRPDILRALLLAVFTLIGILAKILYDELDKTPDENFHILKTIQKAMNSRHSWMAIITSPIIILAFYKTISTIDSYVLISLMSFQNGFFFKSILNKKETEYQSTEVKPVAHEQEH